MKTNQMKRYVDMGVAALVIVVAVVLASYAQAADTYTFTMRGQVKEVDKTNKTVTIYATYVPTVKAQADLSGVKIEFGASGARFYKYDKNSKKVRITIGNIPVESEVVVKGAKRGEDRYNISELTVNPNTFSMVGTVEKHDTGNKIMTVKVSSLDYKESNFKSKDVKVYYGGNTTFKNADGSQLNSDELANNQEGVKVTGKVTNGWKFEAETVIDGYTKAK